ncbi:MAG: hypothetical protein WCH79_18870 [Planctomycetia bacterium]
MQNRSTKPTSSQALKLSLVTIAGATGGMGNDASAGIVTVALNETTSAWIYTGNNHSTTSIYFSYSAGTIGTQSGGVVGMQQGKYAPPDQMFYTSSLNSRITSSPLAANSPIGPSSDWRPNYGPANSGYFGARFLGGGSDWNYGWVQVTTTSNTITFGLASVETTLNTPILAGAVASGVPEIDPASAGSAASLVAGVLAIVEQRRRRRVVPASSVVA